MASLQRHLTARGAAYAAHYTHSALSTQRCGAASGGGWYSAAERRTFTRSACDTLGRLIGK
jgi:hypothetical protein